MWIVRLALRRPYTFVVMSMMIVILGVLACVRMPADIFPEIDIPVVSVIWSYGGISPEEMAEVITIRSERGFTTSVNDIEHMESQSLPGLGIIKVFFHPDAKVEAAVAQLAAASQSVAAFAAAPASTPPNILRYNASSVPILQLGISSDTHQRAAALRLRLQLHPHPDGERRRAPAFPLPYGGRPRQIMVDHRSAGALRAGPLRQRRDRRHQRAEPHPALRHPPRSARSEYAVQAQQPARLPSTPSTACRSADQRHHRLHPRRRPGARRLRGADQHRAPQRRARRAADRAQERRLFHARNRRKIEGNSAAHPLHAAARARI